MPTTISRTAIQKANKFPNSLSSFFTNPPQISSSNSEPRKSGSRKNVTGLPNRFECYVRDQCKSGNIKLEDAVKYFDEMVQMQPIPSIDTFNHILGSISKLKCYFDVFLLYRKMGLVGIEPDLYTLNILINCCSHLGEINAGFCVFGIMLRRGLKADSVTLCTLVKGMCKEGKVLSAVQLLDKMTEEKVEVKVPTFGILN